MIKIFKDQFCPKIKNQIFDLIFVSRFLSCVFFYVIPSLNLVIVYIKGFVAEENIYFD